MMAPSPRVLGLNADDRDVFSGSPRTAVGATQGTGVVARLRPSRLDQAGGGRGPGPRLVRARYPARQGRLPCLKRASSIGQTRRSTANSGQPREVECLVVSSGQSNTSFDQCI